MSDGSPPARASSKKQPRLGRGLSALVGSAPAARVESPRSVEPLHNTNEQTVSGGARLIEAPVDKVRANPFQPRRSFDESALATLAESIKADGVMQPIVVRALDDGYELVAGERRLRASKLAGLASIPAIVREVDDKTSAELALIENLQRADLNPVDRATAFRALIDRHGLTQAELGDRLGMDRSAIANHLRLLELGDSILSMIAEGTLGYAHGRALAGVGEASAREALAQQAADEGWSARATERAVASWNADRAPGPDAENTENAGENKQNEEDRGPDRARVVLDDMERRLGDHLGTRVSIKTDPSGQRGGVTISFFSLDEFDGILERLGYRAGLS